VTRTHTVLFILALTFLPFTAQSAFAQALKIGFVNSSKILEEYSEAQEAKRKLEAFGKQIQDSLEALSSAYQTKLQEYQQKSSLMTEQAKQAAQQELLIMEQRAMDFRERKLGRDGEFSRYQDKVLNPIYDKVKKVIEDIAKEERLTFVFDKTESIQVLLYGDTKYDYTYTVIDRLKRKK
jgi:outer membrane protein